MVAFPDLETEPKLLDVSALPNPNPTLCNGNLTDGRQQDPKPIPNHYDKLKRLADVFAINVDTYGIDRFQGSPDLVKDRGLGDENEAGKMVSVKLPAEIYDNRNGISLPCSPGCDSLSSVKTAVTTATVTTSEPYPEFPNGPPSPGMEERKLMKSEKWHTTMMQISVPFLIAGVGTIGAGLMLSNVQSWPVFVEVSELFIMVPALLGLKGNLDMCLASRLSTQANLGNMSSGREIVKMIIGNVVLVQIQAIVAATLVSIFALAATAVMSGGFNWNHALLMTCAAICTATSSCFVLDFVMIAVIMVARKCKMNPDNVATPLAASIGDFVSITVLAVIASALFNKLDNQIWILYLIIGGYVCLLPVWICIVLKNRYTRSILKTGWTPVLSALFISGLGGLVLDQAVDVFDGFVIFQPIINGVGGNLVSVQASRMSTMLHQTSLPGILPPYAKIFTSPWAALIRGVPYAKTARILIAMSVPGQLLFIFVADYIQWSYSTLHIYFIVAYLSVGVLQVIVLLYLAHVLIHTMWRWKIDPDNSAIPYLTAIGDLSGSLLLAGAFLVLQSIGHEYGDYN